MNKYINVKGNRMKRRFLLLFSFILLYLPFNQISGQEILVTKGDTVIYGNPGATELVLYAHVKNISSTAQTVFLVRTINNLPANWLSSLCFDVNCYPPNVDSAATTEPLQPGDSIEVSVHFYPDQTVPGTGQVQIQLGTMHNPSARTTMNLMASTEPPPAIEVVRGDSVINGPLGSTELVLYAHVINTSQDSQAVFIVRTINNLPQNWTSSLCFDINCYPPTIDSAITLEPLGPGDTIEVSVHFYPDMITAGTGYVQIQLGAINSPNVRTTINETATTTVTSVSNDFNQIKNFELSQNYPNPFNPATTISYSVPQRSDVSLKVYNIIGREVATLVNGEKDPGTYNVNFNGAELSSGVYFYKITAGSFSTVRKMILLK
jgi:hypothetical protein